MNDNHTCPKCNGPKILLDIDYCDEIDNVIEFYQCPNCSSLNEYDSSIREE